VDIHYDKLVVDDRVSTSRAEHVHIQEEEVVVDIRDNSRDDEIVKVDLEACTKPTS
jgi:hypothetical protein